MHTAIAVEDCGRTQRPGRVQRSLCRYADAGSAIWYLAGWSCQTTDCTGKGSAHDVWTCNWHINDCRVLRLANPGVAAGAVGSAPQRQLRSNKEVIDNEL